MGGVKKVLTHVEGGVQKVLAACEGGVKKVWRQKFSIAQPPHRSIYEHSHRVRACKFSNILTINIASILKSLPVSVHISVDYSCIVKSLKSWSKFNIDLSISLCSSNWLTLVQISQGRYQCRYKMNLPLDLLRSFENCIVWQWSATCLGLTTNGFHVSHFSMDNYETYLCINLTR